jgi:hypothetical protein
LTTPTAPKTIAEVSHNIARSLADTLRAYSAAAYKSAQQSDPELEVAYNTISAAEKLVREGRIADALGRCLPEHMKHWPSWIKSDDFEKCVGFDAGAIAARENRARAAAREIDLG